MTDALQQLRAANPVPADPGAPPIAEVRARIAADEPAPVRRPRRWRHWGAVAPALGALAVAAVVAGVVLVIHVRSQPAGPTAQPTGGMRGTVEPSSSGFDGDTGWISFSRCLGGCNGFSERLSSWLATTTDAGRTWTVARRNRALIEPVSGSNQDKWASAVSEHGFGIVATHDGGHIWRAVDVAGSADVHFVSVAGGEVWAAGSGCSGRCGGGILRGPTTGSHLEPTPAAPDHEGGMRAVVALSATSAYVYVPLGAGHQQAWVTADGGRSWSQVAPGCASETVSGSGTGAIWRSCRPGDGRSMIGISTDGGRHWVYRPASFSTGILYASSAQIAWAQTPVGVTMRTTDGGGSWHTVWTPPSEPGLRSPVLSVQSATTAIETASVTHTQDGAARTNLVIYRTTDGGRHWERTPVPLPSR